HWAGRIVAAVRWGCEADRLSVTAEWGHGVAAIGTAVIGVVATAVIGVVATAVIGVVAIGAAVIGVGIGVIIIITVVLTSSSSATSVFRSGVGAGGIPTVTATVMAPRMATGMGPLTATVMAPLTATATQMDTAIRTDTIIIMAAPLTDAAMATDPQLHKCSGGLPR